MNTDIFLPGSRISNFLVQMTTPFKASPEGMAADFSHQAKVLDLVLEIVAEAGFGLSLDVRDRRSSRPVWRLVATKSGGRFCVRPAEHGGFDLEVQLCGATFSAQALTFEALAMSLRSLAVMRCQPETPSPAS